MDLASVHAGRRALAEWGPRDLHTRGARECATSLPLCRFWHSSLLSPRRRNTRFLTPLPAHHAQGLEPSLRTRKESPLAPQTRAREHTADARGDPGAAIVSRLEIRRLCGAPGPGKVPGHFASVGSSSPGPDTGRRHAPCSSRVWEHDRLSHRVDGRGHEKSHHFTRRALTSLEYGRPDQKSRTTATRRSTSVQRRRT